MESWKAAGMVTVSLCMIVRDEEDVLARCLDSVKDLVDEIVIVDTGSKDSTKAIAAEYTEHIYDFKWIQDFAAARNFSFSKATMDYQMWLDADDVIEEKNRDKFLQLKAKLAKPASGETKAECVDIVMLPYHVAFDIHDNPSMTYYRERLIRRKTEFIWQGAVHEVIAPAGRIIYGDAAICHRKIHSSDPDRNLNIYENILKHGEIFDPRHQFYYGRELLYHDRYEDAARVLTKFLDEGRGWLENNISACLNISECLRGLGKKEEALAALFRSFRYDVPRSEVCCAIGDWFLEIGNTERKYLEQAIYWYLRAKEKATNKYNGGFVNPDCYDFIPDIQLCVCYDRLGELSKALEYHEKTKKKKPKDPSVLYNETYFSSKKHS